MNELPKLLYVSDVPVERTMHGALLLYRLLEKYPTDRLMVIEGNIFPSNPGRRLPGVPYQTFRQGWPRLQRTQFSRIFAAGQIFSGPWKASQVERLLGRFQPEAVLTVTYYYAWRTAAALARRRRLPLHLVHHDECIETPLLPGWAKPWVHRIFGKVYRQAASRFCVSPQMAEYYERRYGAPGDVMYPSRGADAQVFAGPPPRLGEEQKGRGLTVAFGGTIGAPGQRRQVTLVCDAVGTMGGTIHLFGPLEAAQCHAHGLAGAHVQLRGTLSSEAFKDCLRREADVLLVPMNMDPGDAMNARISFPSKLVDYTAVGLPLLIIGPEYCSAVQWARENDGVAEVAVGDDPAAIRAALERLQSPARRIQLAETALRTGEKMFSYQAAWTRFCKGLTGGKAARGNPVAKASPTVQRAPSPLAVD